VSSGKQDRLRSPHPRSPNCSYNIFVAIGSDGVRYESKYHFCMDLVVLAMDNQPESLAGFAADYELQQMP
jgi:hypothetical protein